MATQILDDPSGNGWMQPDFDRRIKTLPMLQPNPQSTSAGIERGFIKQAFGNAAGAPQQTTSASGFLVAPRTLYFLYNPSSISVSHSIGLVSDAQLDPNLRSSLDDGQILGPTGGSVSFSLLFDRTYEISNPDNFGRRLAEKGVAVDIEALYALVGIFQLDLVDSVYSPTPLANQVTAQSNAGKAELIAQALITEVNAQLVPGEAPFTIQDILTGATAGNAMNSELDLLYRKLLETRLKAAGLSLSDLPRDPDHVTVGSGNPPGWPYVSTSPTQATKQTFGVMRVTPVVIVFGRQRGTWSPTVEYYGYISSIQVDYAHWTQNMVPVRAGVSIELTLLQSTVDQMTQMAAL